MTTLTKKIKGKLCPTCGSVVTETVDEITEIPDLTPRQREILRMIGKGMTAAEMADELGISRRTAEFHRAVLMEKLRAHSTAKLTLYALAYKLI